MERKARIVRFWLLTAAMLCAVVLWPEVGVGLWPVAFFFPGCACCGNDCGVLAVCNDGTAPNTATVDISGVTGTCGAGNCSSLDGVYVVAWEADLATSCRYGLNLIPAPCVGSSSEFLRLLLFLMTVSGQTRIRVSAQTSGGGGFGILDWASADLGLSPIDCTTIGSQSCSPSADTHVACANAGSTCDVTM